MTRKLINSIILAGVLCFNLPACFLFSGTSNNGKNTDRQLLNHSSIGGSIFIEKSYSNEVIERRWSASTQSWRWVEHDKLNSFLNNLGVTKIFGIGPQLCVDDICRLYIRTDQGVITNHYNLTLSDPDSGADTFRAGNLNLLRFGRPQIDCDTNIVVDIDWRLHCADETPGNGSDFLKYDLALGNVGRLFERHSSQFLIGTQYNSLVANFDVNKVAYVNQGKLYIASDNNPLTATAAHPFTRASLIAIGGDINGAMYGLRERHQLTSRYNSLFKIKMSGGNYDWTRLSKPSYLREYFPQGGIVKIGERKFTMIGKYNGNNERFILERWGDGNGEWWADHGYPSIGQPSRLSDPYPVDDSFFIVTDNDHLVERHFTNATWSWFDHGLIP